MTHTRGFWIIGSLMVIIVFALITNAMVQNVQARAEARVLVAKERTHRAEGRYEILENWLHIWRH